MEKLPASVEREMSEVSAPTFNSSDKAYGLIKDIAGHTWRGRGDMIDRVYSTVADAFPKSRWTRRRIRALWHREAARIDWREVRELEFVAEVERAERLRRKATAGPAKAGAGVLADRPAPVAFTIPLPPSTNHLFKNVKGVGRVKSKAYEDFTLMAVAAIRRQRVPAIGGYVVMLWAFERSSAQADVSNRIKAAEDSIVKAGVIEDDRFVTAHFLTWAPPANGTAHVQIFPASSRMTLDFYPSHDGASGAIIVQAPQPQGDDHGYFAQ